MLQLELQGMLWKLGQQHKWYRLGEMGMRNAESRGKMQREEMKLLREMEFFGSFGEMHRCK